MAAHKYVDLSDNRYGVALHKDCIYGYKIHENVLDLNLLRSPANPDIHFHNFTYSLLPHKGTLIEASFRAGSQFMIRRSGIY